MNQVLSALKRNKTIYNVWGRYGVTISLKHYVPGLFESLFKGKAKLLLYKEEAGTIIRMFLRFRKLRE